MKNLRNYIAPLVACAGILLSPLASATPFSITGVVLAPTGSGYGPESGPNASTTLDVGFSTSIFSAQAFSLNAVGQLFTFNFGSVVLNEPNGNPGITPGETDDLGVKADFIFASPLGATRTITATGVATTGFVNQEGAYAITWGAPLIVNFGTTGSFSLAVSNLTFPDGGVSKNLEATITLLKLDQTTVPGNNVPEPASLTLFGLAALGLAFARKSRS